MDQAGGLLGLLEVQGLDEHDNFAVFGGEFEGVRENVEKDLLYTLFISLDEQSVTFDFVLVSDGLGNEALVPDVDLNFFHGRLVLHDTDYLLDSIFNVEYFNVFREILLFASKDGVVQDIVDEEVNQLS